MIKIIKLIFGVFTIFLSSVGISFVYFQYTLPPPDPKAPEDIVWEFLIKDKPMNPEVLKQELLSYREITRGLETDKTKLSNKIDSLHISNKKRDELFLSIISDKDIHNNTIKDSLISEIKSLNVELQLKDLEISEYQNQMDLISENIKLSNTKKSNEIEREKNLEILAKTYESMRLRDMSNIVKGIDDDTLIKIYLKMSTRKRQNILLALGNKRAATITKKLSSLNQY